MPKRRDDYTTYLMIALVVGFVLAMINSRGCVARAKAESVRPEDAATARLALGIARLGMNEANGRPADVALIHQCTLAHGETHAERYDWLRRHSRRVLGRRYCASHRRCQWTRNLTWSDARPRGYPPGLRWERRVETWRAVRLLARELVEGKREWLPCEEQPWTWGGRMDHQGAVAAGMRRVRCEGTRNRGYAWR